MGHGSLAVLLITAERRQKASRRCKRSSPLVIPQNFNCRAKDQQAAEEQEPQRAVALHQVWQHLASSKRKSDWHSLRHSCWDYRSGRSQTLAAWPLQKWDACCGAFRSPAAEQCRLPTHTWKASGVTVMPITTCWMNSTKTKCAILSGTIPASPMHRSQA